MSFEYCARSSGIQFSSFERFNNINVIVSLSNFAAISRININDYVLIDNYNVKNCIESVEINFDISVNGYLF